VKLSMHCLLESRLRRQPRRHLAVASSAR